MLSELCIQAHQQKAAMAIRHFAASSLGLWLYKASAFRASPTSRLAVSVQQQLQGSGLLQHMGALLTAAADGLTAAAAVVFGEPAHSSNSRGPSSSCGGTGGKCCRGGCAQVF